MSRSPSYRRHLLATAVASVALAGVSTAAFAGAFGIREQSTIGQGMSFAGMAAGGGDSISGMFWNPAVVNDVEYFQGEQHVTGIIPTSKVDVKGNPLLASFGDGGNIGKNALLSAGYGAYRINDRLAVGLSVNTPFGLATDPNHAWGGQLLGRSSRVRSFTATPTVGYKITDWLSVGAGFEIQYFDIRLRQAQGIGPAAPSATLRGDDVGFGFTAGVNIRPMEGTDIGIGFRSMIKQNLDGSLKGLPVPLNNQDVKASLKLPETVTVGIRQRVTQELTILGGVEWTNWSRLGTIPIKGSFPAQVIPLDYRDGWFYSVGAEYKINPAWTVRGGVAYEKSPVTDATRLVRLPDDNRWWFSGGATYNYSERLSFDVGYSYVHVPGKSPINAATPAGPFSAEAKSHVHILSLALRYKIGAEPASAPLVTKF